MYDSELQILVFSIGWALIHFLWQGTLITLAYWVISRNIQSIYAKYWTGMALVLVSLITPVINVKTTQPIAYSESEVTLLAANIMAPQQLNIENLFLYLINASLPYLVLLWAFTVAFLVFRVMRSWLKLAAIEHECEPHVSRQIKQCIKNITIMLDLPKTPLLKVSRQVMVPAVYGIFKPTVMIPLSLISQIPQDQLEAVIKHELCHLKRNDFVHNIIQLIADILLFFHPGIRWMNNDIRHVREQCCDQMVLSHNTETITYAKALTNIAAFSNGIHLKPSIQLGINDGALLNRVKILLQNKSSQSSAFIFIPILLIILFTTIMLQPVNADKDAHATNNLLLTTEQKTGGSNTVMEQQNYNETLQNLAFYPRLAQNNESSRQLNDTQLLPENTSQVIPTEQPNFEFIGINKAELHTQLSSDIRPPEYNTNQLDVKLSELKINLPKATVQARVEPETNTVNGLPLTNLQTNAERLNNNQINNTLSSFNNVESIRPQFKRYKAPEYPNLLWHSHVEQDVIATYKIRANGQVYDITLNSSKNNFAAFEQAVYKAMRNWRFDTNSLNNSTLQRTFQQSFSFTLSDKVMQTCESKTTGSRLNKSLPCNK